MDRCDRFMETTGEPPNTSMHCSRLGPSVSSVSHSITIAPPHEEVEVDCRIMEGALEGHATPPGGHWALGLAPGAENAE